MSTEMTQNTFRKRGLWLCLFYFLAERQDFGQIRKENLGTLDSLFRKTVDELTVQDLLELKTGLAVSTLKKYLLTCKNMPDLSLALALETFRDDRTIADLLQHRILSASASPPAQPDGARPQPHAEQSPPAQPDHAIQPSGVQTLKDSRLELPWAEIKIVELQRTGYLLRIDNCTLKDLPQRLKVGSSLFAKIFKQLELAVSVTDIANAIGDVQGMELCLINPYQLGPEATNRIKDDLRQLLGLLLRITR